MPSDVGRRRKGQDCRREVKEGGEGCWRASDVLTRKDISVLIRRSLFSVLCVG